MSSPQKGGTSFLPEDNSDFEETQLGDFSPVITRAAARRNAERLAAFQQAQQLSPGPSTSKGKEPEFNPSPKTSEQLRLDRIEIMMERLLGTMQVLAEAGSRHSSRRTSPVPPSKIPTEKLEPSRDPPAPYIDPQDQLPNPIPSQVQPSPVHIGLQGQHSAPSSQVQPPPAHIGLQGQHPAASSQTRPPPAPYIGRFPNSDPPSLFQSPVLLPTIRPTVPTSTDKRDQSLEAALAKSRADRLARANIPGDRLRFSTPAALNPHDETDTPVSMEYPREAFQRVLDYMSLHPQEPGDPHQRSGPNAQHPVLDDGSRHPTLNPSIPRRNPVPTPSNPAASRANPIPRAETQAPQSNVDSHGETEPIISGKIHKIPSDILIPLDPDKGATNLYCKNLERLVDIYGELSVLAAIPGTLQGRAKDWFAANILPRTSRNSVASWITALKAAFPVDPDAWGIAQDRRYNPSSDNSVMDYFYNKVNLLRTADQDIGDSDIKKSIWRGLPGEFQFVFDYDEIQNLSIETIGTRFLKKDPSFRKTWIRNHRMRNQQNQSSRSEHRDRSWKPPETSSRSERRDRSRKAPETSRSLDKAKKNKSTSSKWSPSTPKPSPGTKKPSPPRLPRDEWRKDKEGRIMTRRCQHCDGWHFDFDCPKRPKSFSIKSALNQSPDSDTEDEETLSSASDKDDDNDSDSPDDASSYSNVSVYSNGRRTLKPFSHTVVPQAEKFAIQQIPASDIVGTGVSYLSAEPCPVKAWVGVEPHSDAPLSSGVVDSGGPSIIQQDLVPKHHKILPSPCNPKFHGIGNNTTGVQGYVVLPMYLPNAAAIAGDASEARVLCLSVEFQVVEHVAAGFLIGRDATKAYKAIIDEELGQIVFPTYSPPFYVPITETSREEAQKMDARVFAAKSVSVRPRSETLVPIRLECNLKKIGSDILISPVRKLASLMVSMLHARIQLSHRIRPMCCTSIPAIGRLES